MLKKIKIYLSAKGLPDLLESKCQNLSLIGVGLCVFGIIFTIFGIIKKYPIGLILMPNIAGLILIAYASSIRISIAKNGFIEIQGVCDRHSNIIKFLPGQKNKADEFGVKASLVSEYRLIDEYIRIVKQQELSDSANSIILSSFNRNVVPAIGQKVVIYISCNSVVNEDSKGLVHYNNILGYKLSSN